MDSSFCSDFYPDRILTETPAFSLIRTGGILLFPTETFYAMGTNFLSLPSLSAICVIKDRPSDKPLPLAASDVCQVEALCATESFSRSLFSFWPAPLTIVLPLREPSRVPLCVQNTRGEIAVRVSSHPTVRALAAFQPITVSSANLAGKKPARGLSSLDPILLRKLAESGLPWGLLDGPETSSSLPSTIVRPENGVLRVLRKGAYSLSLLRDAGFSLLCQQ